MIKWNTIRFDFHTRTLNAVFEYFLELFCLLFSKKFICKNKLLHCTCTIVHRYMYLDAFLNLEILNLEEIGTYILL